MYACPVCGYPEMEGKFDPFSYDICPCCGTEYGYNDCVENPQDLPKRHAELRQLWIDGGMKWWFNHRPIPDGWDPLKQLEGMLS